MEATQLISNSILESDEEENENEKEQQFAKLCILKNNHIPETDLPLFLGDNVLGRDPSICTLPLSAASVSKQHATICISAYRRRGSNSKVDIEALVWDLGSMNGTRKGRLKMTPNVRYALSDGDSLLVADIPCQYHACGADSISRNLAVKERLPGALERKEGDASSKKSVSGGVKAVVSSLTTPARTTCLSFEQTPTQPQGTLVPESESDSDGERGVDRRHKELVSSSGSHKSSPTCSTFTSPTNKIVPESEDESPITPSSVTINRPLRHVSVSMETQLEVGRQLLEGKKAHAVVRDCENEARTAPDGKSGQLGLVKQHCSAIPVQEDVLSVSTTAVTRDLIPEFNMNSDTDMEGEEEGEASVGSLNLNTKQVDQPPNSAQFHMDSDTDVDENEDTIDKAHKTVPSSDDLTKIPQVNSVFQPEGITVVGDTHVDADEDTIDQDPEAVPLSDDNPKPTHDSSVIQPEGITVDSDTDVDDDDAAVSDAVTKAKPMSVKTSQIADSAPVMQPNDFHLDSDTDVDEEEDMECQTNKPSSKMDETSPRLDIKPVEHDSAPAAPHRLHLDSDTDDEAVPAPAPCEPGAVSAAPDSCTTTSGGVDVLCDSDTDVDDNCPVVKPAVVRTSSVSPGTTSEALESVSNADTDVDGSSMPPVGDRANPPDLEGESNRDEEDQETAECQIASLCRGKTPRSLAPPLQKCSTPVQSSEDLEVMETQAFLSPSSAPIKCLIAAVGGHAMLSSCSDSQDEDFVVAETQSFILQTRDGQSNPPEDHTMEPTQAFALEPTDNESDEQSSRERSLQLGLSDSSHLECQAQVLATENTQAFIPVDQSVNMEEAHTHSAVSSVYRTSAEINLNMVAAQLYGMNEEPARCSAMSIKDQVDLALEQTQTYTSEPHSVSEKETDEDERENMIADAETQPLGFPMVITLAMAETQPLSGFEGEESLAVDEPVSGMRQASSISQNETRMKASHEAAAQPQERPHDDLLCLPETQLMNMCEDEESNNEDAILGPQQGKANQLQLRVEQAQLPMSYNLPIVDTQPMARSENEESDDGDLIPVFRRRAKPLQIEDETQRLSSPEVSATETKPSGECKGGQSDEEDLPPRPRNRKARRLQIEEEQTQPVAIETQPIVTSEEEERNNENLIPGPPSAVDTKSLETQTAEQPERQREGESEAGTHGVSVRNKRGTRATFREAEEQAECSEPPKTQTRGNNKALTTTRGRRGKSRPDEDESEEELVEQVRRARGKRSLRQRKHKEEGEQFKMEKGECAENNSLIKEKQEGELEEERNVAGVRHHSEEMENKKGKVGRKHRGEEDDKLELERKEKEEQERLQAENTERIRLEQERIEKERKEFEEKERLEHQRAEQAEKERIEKERLDKEKQELEERLEKERKEEARLQREADEREERERLQKEKENREKQVKGQQKIKVVNDPKVTIRGRKAARRTVTALCTTEPQQDLTLSTNDDFPAKRTRSRSNSSNSVSSERSASSLTPQEARGRSGGRGNTSSSKPPQATTTGSRGRRRTVAAKTPEQDSRDISPQEVRSRSNSSNSLNSDISSCSINSQNRGRGNRQQGRLRKTEPGTISIPTFSNQSDLNSTPKPAARGRKSRKIEGSSQVVRQEDEEKADSQPAVATRGQQRETEPSAANEDKPNQEEGAAHEDSPLPKRIATGRRQKAAKRDISESPLAPAVRDGEETKDKRKGRKRELETKADEDSSNSAKVRKGKEKAQKTEAADEEGTDSTKEIPLQVQKEVRTSVAQPKKNAKESPLEAEVKEDSEKIEDIVRKVRGRPSAVQKKKKEEQTESGEWNDGQVEASEPQTPTTSASRKRQAPMNSSPVAKTLRSSSASPAARGRQQAASQAYKVLFTGLVDEEGERVLARLRGSMAKGVADMNCLVTDKVRRTVKFLCAVAKGIPIVTTQWLEKSGKAGSFLSPNAYVVKDSEQEKKFGFCLKESLSTASSQPLLQGYEIHVTKSVKPEPAQMKDIISCSGATFLPKMPSSPKPQTVVISCEEDWLLCGPAVSVALPVVTAEFILTGILQQKVDFQTHALSLPITNLQLAGRGKGRKKP
ncbi:mediator of DNA damage checkpoint protein 1 isoform X2 [Echeneis naucrates]|uniref:mediator of DNA damage checkpoint protein 1 isoform X2 n=1 Tax=Echeneis naucrates TaxID=173247 RepID=UPI001113CCB6|nr:mediator of DNA damage checkpoint protein 1 isoform X2 [Echeneis naucrates]